MEFRKLGCTDLSVSRICLGTMTWGYQNTQEEAFAQIEYALDQGVNFMDTAEMYAVPPSADSYGTTESIIGHWFAKTGRRNDVILASKMAGPGMAYCREGRGLVKGDVKAAVEASLTRLQTDVIDLYQLHWPQRRSNFFGQRDYQDIYAAEKEDYIFQILEGLAEVIQEGKVRHIGLSNETPYGMMKYLEYARYHNMPRMQSVQNPYSLVQRQWDTHSAEVALRENIGLLAYSPLAGGFLSGKYLGGKAPENSRFALWGRDRMPQYLSGGVGAATQAYVELAKQNGLSPVQLAIAWINSRAHVTSTIVGATSIGQLKEVLSAKDISLAPHIIHAVEEIHEQYPSPALTNWGARNPKPTAS